MQQIYLRPSNKIWDAVVKICFLSS